MHSFDVGTNRVPYDMVAQIHKDEAIIPAADNRLLMQRLSNPADNNAVLSGAVERLTQEVAGLRAEARATAQHTEKTARILGRAVVDDALVTRAEEV